MVKDPFQDLAKEIRAKSLKDVTLAVIAAVLFLLLLSVPVMFAWNCVIPHLTGLPDLTFLETFSFVFLFALTKNVIKN